MTEAVMARARGLALNEANRRWWTLGAMCFALFMIMLDNTVVNVALPSIQRELHASLSSLEWTINAYTLTFAVLLVTGGRRVTGLDAVEWAAGGREGAPRRWPEGPVDGGVAWPPEAAGQVAIGAAAAGAATALRRAVELQRHLPARVRRVGGLRGEGGAARGGGVPLAHGQGHRHHDRHRGRGAPGRLRTRQHLGAGIPAVAGQRLGEDRWQQ